MIPLANIRKNKAFYRWPLFLLTFSLLAPSVLRAETRLDIPGLQAESKVKVSEGKLMLPATDIYISGPGFPLELTRTYNSKSKYMGPFGYGWNFNYGYRIIHKNINDYKPYILRPDSTETSFHYHEWEADYPICYYESTENDKDIMLFDASQGIYTVTDRFKNKKHFGFTPLGNIPIKMEDANGNLTTLTYEIKDVSIGDFTYQGLLLTAVTDSVGRSLTFTYTPDNRCISSVTDPLGRTTYYDYSGYLLRKVTDPAGNKTYYDYNSSRNLTKITYPDETSVTYTYDNDKDRVTGVYGPEGIKRTYRYTESLFADDFRNIIITSETDARNKSTVYTYTMGHEWLFINKPLSSTKARISDFRYLLSSEIDENNHAVSYTYDETGNKLTKKYLSTPEDDTWRYIYEPAFNKIKTVTDPRGHGYTVICTYDYELDQQDPNYAKKGNLIEKEDALGNSTTYTYYPNGLLKTVTDANSHTASYEYDAYGYKFKITDAKLNETTFDYDIAGQLLSKTDARGNTTTYEYDEMDNLIKVTDAQGSETSYVYDSMNRKISETKALGLTTTYTYTQLGKLKTTTDPLNNTTEYFYDAEANKVETKDAEGNSTYYAYDDLNRLITVTDALGHSTHYEYDPVGNRTKITDARDNATTFEYDTKNRLTTMTYPDASYESYSYDKADNLVQKQKRSEDIIDYSYNEINQLETTTYPDSSAVTNDYDPVGNLLSEANANISYTYTYNELNRPINIVSTPGGITSYTYDKVGNRVTLSYPNAQVASYTYDNLNRLGIVHTPQGTAAYYTYDTISRRIQKNLPNGVSTTYTYDNASRLTELINSPTGQLANFAYTYDNVGNRLSMTANEGTHSYTYDDIYQLTDVSYPTDTAGFVYDEVGNRETSNEGAPLTYASNNLNQYSQVAGANYTYDDNGNLTNDGTYIYTYDYENRLISAVGNGHTAAYKYDTKGRRIQATINGTVTNFLYDGDNLIAEANAGYSIIKTYVNGANIDEILQVTRYQSPVTRYYYLYDGLGSVTDITDDTGSLVEHYTYTVYGKPAIYDDQGAILTTSSVDNSYYFTGRRLDSETSLYYYRARYYSYKLGRFLQTDPVGYEAGINLYAYCGNNPVLYIDPSGLVWVITRPVRKWGITWGRHGYFKFDDCSTASLNREDEKTWVGPERKALSPEEEKKWRKWVDLDEDKLREAIEKAKSLNDPKKDDVDGEDYKWSNWPKPSNSSNDWINRRLKEAGGESVLDYKGRWL